MSDYIRFTKEGLFEFEWDSETRTYPSHRVPESGVISKLRMECRIDLDCTLRDIFATVGSYPILVAFIAQYSWCWAIKEFHESVKLPSVHPDTNGLTHLQISKYIESSTYENAKTFFEPCIDSSLDFCAIGKTGEHGGDRYGISLTPMQDIAHLTVRLKDKCDVRLNFETKGSYETTFSLLEVLDAIYDDISFHGGPAQAEEFSKELISRFEDVKSGRATLVPFEDVDPEVVN